MRTLPRARPSPGRAHQPVTVTPSGTLPTVTEVPARPEATVTGVTVLAPEFTTQAVVPAGSKPTAYAPEPVAMNEPAVPTGSAIGVTPLAPIKTGQRRRTDTNLHE